MNWKLPFTHSPGPMNRREAMTMFAGATAGLAFGGMGFSGSGLAAAKASPKIDPSTLDLGFIDKRIQQAVDTGKTVGAGLVLFTKDRVFYKKAFGTDTPETIHLLYSATKLASCTCLMTLVDDELIALDDPIRKYLPQFGPVRGAITLRQLMSQTHGLPGRHKAIPAPQKDNGLTLEQAVNEIARDDDRVEYPPGSKHHYQPVISYHIVGRIAEVVTGESWATLFKKRLKDPCDMRTFTYGDTPNPRIGGGAVCGLQDYQNLVLMHLNLGTFNGRRVLSEKMVREMYADQLHGIPFTPAGSMATYGYGLSWWFNMVDEAGAPVQTSVPGGTGAIPWINWPLGYGGFLHLVEGLPVSAPIYEDIYPELNTALGLPTAKIKMDPERLKILKEKAGKKRGGRRSEGRGDSRETPDAAYAIPSPVSRAV
ncbi:MAG: beta-lactamase family protein [Nevskiales bacterium]|nr:beta-lactamase family protein [Nevskiales bacterium]